MKTVILLRHAKSSWMDSELDDHDRPLNRRGKRAAPVTALWIKRNGYLPDRVVCSTSRRTRQTVKRMRAAVPDLPEPVLEPGLYLAAPQSIVELVSTQPEASERVMLVGHQPGLSACARALVNGSVRPGCHRAFEHFPTAAAAVLQLPVDRWSDVTLHTAEFVDFAMPRELDAVH
ncbi:MAG: histidine phosphatase family protein [Pseudomonadota bacterium]